jgi:hypothetical protein
MLGKYWSLFLLAGLALAALCDPRRGAYFRSPAAYLTIAAGAAVLGPHLFFIATHGFTTVDFAFTSHATTLAHAAIGSLYFLFSVIGYIAAPIVLGTLATMPSIAAFKDTLWPAGVERRMVLIAFVAPLVIAALVAVAAHADLDPLWSMSAMTLLPVVLFGSPLLSVNRAAATYILAFTIVFPLLMVGASPMIAVVIHHNGVPNYASHYRLIAQAIERAWRGATDRPLRIVGGNRPVVDGSNFYFTDTPATFVLGDPRRTPWVDEARIEREGIAIVCPSVESNCVQEMRAYSARYGGRLQDVTIARSYFGTPDGPIQYLIAVIPPH